MARAVMELQPASPPQPCTQRKSLEATPLLSTRTIARFAAALVRAAVRHEAGFRNRSKRSRISGAIFAGLLVSANSSRIAFAIGRLPLDE
jgi:hypothetical protein